MTPFEFLSVALSFVLGLAVTLLLTSMLRVFRARKRLRLDGITFAWVIYIFVFQIQYWWAIFELSALPQWTLQMFALTLVLAIILFVAGGLILPSSFGEYPHDLREYFAEDGRWGVVALASYGVAGIVGNVLLFGGPAVSVLHGLIAAQSGCGAVVAFTKSRPLQVVATAVAGLTIIYTLILATPPAY